MEVDEFLEHFGVKGMRWGVRKNRSSGSDDSPESSRKETAKKVLKVSAATAAVAGAAFAAYSLNRAGSVKVSEVRQATGTVRVGADAARRIAQQRATMAQVTARLGETNRLADAQLKDWYNKLDVPLRERTYSSARG